MVEEETRGEYHKDEAEKKLGRRWARKVRMNESREEKEKMERGERSGRDG